MASNIKQWEKKTSLYYKSILTIVYTLYMLPLFFVFPLECGEAEMPSPPESIELV